MKYPGVNVFTSGISSRRETRPPTGVPSLDYASQIVVGQFSDAVLLAVESPTVARAPATLAEYLGTILPISVVQLSGEYDRINITGCFGCRSSTTALSTSGCGRSFERRSLR